MWGADAHLRGLRCAYILHPTSYILHPTYYILHTTSYILHPASPRISPGVPWVPISEAGKIIAIGAALAGTIILALPIAVVGVTFDDEWAKKMKMNQFIGRSCVAEYNPHLPRSPTISHHLPPSPTISHHLPTSPLHLPTSPTISTVSPTRRWRCPTW